MQVVKLLLLLLEGDYEKLLLKLAPKEVGLGVKVLLNLIVLLKLIVLLILIVLLKLIVLQVWVVDF